MKKNLQQPSNRIAASGLSSILRSATGLLLLIISVFISQTTKAQTRVTAGIAKAYTINQPLFIGKTITATQTFNIPAQEFGKSNLRMVWSNGTSGIWTDPAHAWQETLTLDNTWWGCSVTAYVYGKLTSFENSSYHYTGTAIWRLKNNNTGQVIEYTAPPPGKYVIGYEDSNSDWGLYVHVFYDQYPLPDFVPQTPTYTYNATTQQLTVTTTVRSNTGASGSPVSVALYKGSVSSANLLATAITATAIPNGGSATVTFTKTLSSIDRNDIQMLIVRVNDNGTTFPVLAYETNTTNNESQVSIPSYTINYNPSSIPSATLPATNPTTYNILKLPLTLTDPTPPTGYTFSGWTGSNGSTPQASYTIPGGTTGNLTYTANYTTAGYTITYALNGGTVSAANPTSYNITTPNFTLNNPVKTGYTFLGWSGTGLTGTANTAVTVPTGSTGDRSYTANWSAPNAYTISYVLPPGTLHPQTPNTYTYEDNVTVPNPVLYGYTFTGWNITNDDAASPVVTPTINVNWMQHNIFGNLTFDANNLATSWSKITYNITYDLDGGTHGSSHPNTYTVTDNVTIDIPTKTGYTFGGWTISCDSASATLPSSGNPTTFGPGSNVFGNLNFRANWTTDQYMITYNPGAPDASLDNPPANNPTTYNITDTPITLDDGGAHRNGYTFDKWKIESSVTSVTIPDGMNIPAGTIGNLTCTALWNLNGYTISYTIPSGVTHPQTPTNYNVTNSVTVANPSAPGFTFKEWTITNDEATSPAIAPKIGVSWAANTVFGNLNFSVASPSSSPNPNWDEIVYNITYDYDGGTPSATPNPTTYTVTTPAITLHEPTKAGYTFTGWTFVSSESSVHIPAGNTIPQGTIGNLTCTAVWNTVPYNITYTDPATGNPVVTSPANPSSYHIATPGFRLNNPPAKDAKHRFVGWTGTDIASGKRLSVTVPTGSMGDRAYEAYWSSALRDRYTLNNDTLIACEAPQRIQSGHDGLSYEWIFPDGTPHTTSDIDATVNGRYILRTNYGDTIVNDTIYVQLAFEAGQRISRLSTLPIKIDKSQQFSVNIPTALHSYTTYAWTFEGGTPATSTLATPDVVWNATGERKVTASVSITHGTLTCTKRFETKIRVYPKQRGFFVDQNVGGGALDGSSWSNAFKTIEDALSNASQGDFIWVAQGEYTPPTGTAYRMQTDSIEIYGGFNATENHLNERQLGLHPTILKGSGTSVIENIDMPSGGARWDGFTVEEGKASYGAGIYNRNASVTIANSIIRGNTASEEGGGVWSTQGNPVYVNVEISGNISKQGAGMYHLNASPMLLNVTIAGNQGIESAGGMYNNGGAADIRNTIIYGNRAPVEASVKNEGYAIPAYSHSLIEGSGGSHAWNSIYGNDNGSNKDANPIFLHSGFDEDGAMRKGKYTLAAQSPAVDMARNAFVLNMPIRKNIHLSTLANAEKTQGIPLDLAGNARIENSTVDMGAYEYRPNMFSPDLPHPVIIPEIPGLVTVPGKGIHYIKRHEDFKLLLTPLPEYNLKNIKIQTGDPLRDKDGAGIKYDYRPDGSVLVTIIKVMRPITIEISGVTVANEIVDEHIKVWTNENMLHIETDKPMNVSIYTIAGQLYKKMKLPAGKTEHSLPSGIYIVTFNGNRQYKVFVN